jgi:mannose-6-phosphate isomerase-like protein (cupin superfamily)
MDNSRRTLLQSLPLGLSAFALGASAWGADQPITSFATPFDQLPVHTNGANVSRPILNGVAHDGSYVEVHETTLAPGSEPHPPHHHEHEEMFLLSRGTIAVTIAGKTTTLGPGSAAFIHSGEQHGVRNTGTEPAQYFVVALGKQT